MYKLLGYLTLLQSISRKGVFILFAPLLLKDWTENLQRQLASLSVGLPPILDQQLFLPPVKHL